MKKLTVFAVLALAIFAAPMAVAGISGTAHDLSARGFGTTELCIFCHTPHNAKTPQLAPLWNHTSTAVAAYTLYSSPSLNAAPGQPADSSRACLSCHDGTVGIDAYAARVGTAFVTAANNLGSDLSNDHPISFTYDSTLATADGGLVTPASASLVSAGVPLFASQMQCASCHSVHNNANGMFLRVANTGSALCLKCHVK